jgi:hypothetical protein
MAQSLETGMEPLHPNWLPNQTHYSNAPAPPKRPDANALLSLLSPHLYGSPTKQ